MKKQSKKQSKKSFERLDSFYQQDRSLGDIWNWYYDQQTALFYYRSKVFNYIKSNDKEIPDRFFGMTSEELDSYFQNNVRDLEHLVAFDLMSFTEALLNESYKKVATRRMSSKVSREIITKKRALNRQITLIDIVDIWKDRFTSKVNLFNEYLSLLHYRIWIAHGRYWTPKWGQRYTLEYVYDVSDRIYQFIHGL